MPSEPSTSGDTDIALPRFGGGGPRECPAFPGDPPAATSAPEQHCRRSRGPGPRCPGLAEQCVVGGVTVGTETGWKVAARHGRRRDNITLHHLRNQWGLMLGWAHSFAEPRYAGCPAIRGQVRLGELDVLDAVIAEMAVVLLGRVVRSALTSSSFLQVISMDRSWWPDSAC